MLNRLKFRKLNQNQSDTSDWRIEVWVKRWSVVGTSGKSHIVALDSNGDYGCDCMAWTTQPRERWVNGKRRDCQHILLKRMESGNVGSSSVQTYTTTGRQRVVRLED